MRKLLLAAALSTLTLTACAHPTITGEAAHALVEGQGAVLLDVRSPGEFGDKHLDGALNVPVGELEEKLGSLNLAKDKAVIVYCRSGARSARAAGILQKAGFSKVHDLGGMSNWK